MAAQKLFGNDERYRGSSYLRSARRVFNSFSILECSQYFSQETKYLAYRYYHLHVLEIDFMAISIIAGSIL